MRVRVGKIVGARCPRGNDEQTILPTLQNKKE
jgi:hypothetical protein